MPLASSTKPAGASGEAQTEAQLLFSCSWCLRLPSAPPVPATHSVYPCWGAFMPPSSPRAPSRPACSPASIRELPLPPVTVNHSKLMCQSPSSWVHSTVAILTGSVRILLREGTVCVCVQENTVMGHLAVRRQASGKDLEGGNRRSDGWITSHKTCHLLTKSETETQ